MQILPAQTRHIPQIIRLLQQVGQVHHKGRPDLFRENAQKYNEEQLRDILANENTPVFVACREDTVLGYGFCQIKQTVNHSVMADHKSLYIDDICVDEDCRRQHVGAALYRYITEYARSAGCNSVTLNVWAFNESALAFYKSLGMQPRNICMEQKLEEEKC